MPEIKEDPAQENNSLVSRCKHYDICGRDVEGNPADGLCILHSPDPAKDTDAFAEAFAAHREHKRDNFVRFVFPRSADFTRATFTQEADFTRATFTQEADFAHATFAKGANFFEATFTQEADFLKATFTQEVDFTGATFTQEAYFTWATFTERARFFKATFTKRADFTGATFTQEADFAHATFSEGTNFLQATFTKRADFTGATFTQEADFAHATFTERARFRDATFTQEADFTETTFTQEADFTWATFTERARFFKAMFSGRTLFAGRPGSAQADHIFAGTVVDFRQVVINPPDVITFLGADLTKCQFLDTDLRKVQLVDVKWPQRGQRVVVYDEIAQVGRPWVLQLLLWVLVVIPILWTGTANLPSHLGYGGRQSWSLWFDEVTGWGIWIVGIVIWIAVVQRVGRWIEPKYGPWPQIERLYRELKQNYEDRRDYERAGDFHYGEKEMRRQNPGTPRGLRFFLTLYWLFSGYGERYLRPLFWAGLLFVGSTIGYMWWGLSPNAGGASLTWTNRWDWLQGAYYSFRVMTFLKPDDWVPVGYAHIMNTVQTLLSPLFLGLFALALRQRLKR